MNVIVFVDDNGGMQFNHRRQSKDKRALDWILTLTTGGKLWMAPYSQSLFEVLPSQANISEDFLSLAGPGEFCLVEDRALRCYEDKIEKIIFFHWNRVYPADRKFDVDLSSGHWHHEAQEEFVGSSHEKITMEVYSR